MPWSRLGQMPIRGREIETLEGGDEEMRVVSSCLKVLAASSVLVIGASLPASAACTRLGFSVNDYGKDGPTKDAKDLLDKYIAKWTGEHGIAKYTTGKKDVNCELFLNFILFDEHTCKAEATVCWDGSPLPKSEQISAETTTSTEKPAVKQSTGSIDKAASKPADKSATKVEGAAAVKTESHAAIAPKEAPKDAAPATPADVPKLVKPESSSEEAPATPPAASQ